MSATIENASAARARRVHWVLLVMYYAWMPAAYLAIYVPFIVPRLAGWPRVPTIALLATFGPFLLVSIAVGALLNHRRIVVHAILAAATIQLCEFIGGLMHAPGLAKGWAETDQTVFWLVLLPVKALALILLGEVGHAAAGMLRGAPPGRGVAPH